MNRFLKDGDEVVADNIKLIYTGGVFILPTDGLDHAVKYVYDIETELECEVLFETGEDVSKPYYDKPNYQ